MQNWEIKNQKKKTKKKRWPLFSEILGPSEKGKQASFFRPYTIRTFASKFSCFAIFELAWCLNVILFNVFLYTKCVTVSCTTRFVTFENSALQIPIT